MARGLRAAEGAMAGGNPIEMGSLVLAHNVFGWTPEESAAFAAFVSTGISFAGSAYAKSVRESRASSETSTPAPTPVPAPRSAAELLAGRQGKDVAVIEPHEDVVPASIFNYLPSAADALREAAQTAMRERGEPGIGPALAVATIEPYGYLYTGINEAPPRPLHPVIEARVAAADLLPSGPARPYYQLGDKVHAEILALSEAFYALEEREKRSVTWEEGVRLIELDISSAKHGGGMAPCARCALIVEGIRLTRRTKAAIGRQGASILSGEYPEGKPF
jgi:hypothetical protein